MKGAAVLSDWIIKTTHKRTFLSCLLECDKEYPIDILHVNNIMYGVTNNTLYFEYQNNYYTNFSSDLPTWCVFYTQNYQYLPEHFSNMGIRCFPSPYVLDLANHKHKTISYVASLGVPCVNTMFTLPKLTEQLNTLTYPLILKMATGSGGKGVTKVSDSQTYIQNTHQINTTQKQYMIQSSMLTGDDLRIYMIGEKPIYGLMRPMDNDINRTCNKNIINYNIYELQKQYPDAYEYAITITKSLKDTGFLAIDFLFDDSQNKRKAIFNEINAAMPATLNYLIPHYNGNFISEYINYIETQL